jgi:hypothetical protein
VVLPVDQKDLGIGLGEGLAAFNPGEATSENDNFRFTHFIRITTSGNFRLLLLS